MALYVPVQFQAISHHMSLAVVTDFTLQISRDVFHDWHLPSCFLVRKVLFTQYLGSG